MSERYKGDEITVTTTTWAERVFKLPQLKEKIRGIFEGQKARLMNTMSRIASGGFESRTVFKDDEMIKFIADEEKKRNKSAD